MGKKKGRQQQSSNTPVAVDSSESGDAQESTANSTQVSNKQVCQHVNRAVDINNIKKNITTSENQACARCTKLGITPVLGDGTWFCLRCGNRSCSLKHSEEHHETPHSDLHCLAIQLPPFIVRCHSCKTELPDDFNKKLNFCITNLRQMHIKGQLDLKSEESSSVENKDKEQEVVQTAMETNSKPLEEKKIVIIKPPSPAAVRGLSNLGNTCFFNSVLQCLARTPNLIDVLKQMNAQDKPIDITLKSGKHLVGKLDKWDTLSESLAETMESILTAGSVFSPNKLLNLLREKCPQFEGYDQHDAHELLRHLLDAVRTNDLKRYRKVMLAEMGLNSKVNRQEVSEEKRKQLKQLDNEVCEAVTLVPEHVFKGLLVSTLECQECNSTSQCVESFLDLSLPVMSEKPQPPSSRRKNNSTVALEEKGGSQVSKHQLKKERKMARKQKGKKHNGGGPNGARKDPANQTDTIPENDEKGSDAEGDIEDNEEVGCCEDKRHESGYSSEKLGGSTRDTPSVSSASDSARASPSSITDTLDSLHLQQPPGERPPIPLPPPPPHHHIPSVIPLPYYERPSMPSPPPEEKSSPVSEEISPVSLPLLEEPLVLSFAETPSEDIPEESSSPVVDPEERLLLPEELVPVPLTSPLQEGSTSVEGERQASPVPKVRPPMPLPPLEQRSPFDAGALFSCVYSPHVNDRSLNFEQGLYICTGLPPVKQVPPWLYYRIGLDNKWTLEQDALEKAKFKSETGNSQWNYSDGLVLDDIRLSSEEKFHPDGSPDFTKLLLRNSKYPELKMKIKSGLTIMNEDPDWKERLNRFQSWSTETGKCHSNKKVDPPPVFESRFDTDFRLYSITDGTNEEVRYRAEGVKGGEGGDPDFVKNNHPQRPTILRPPQDLSDKCKRIQKAEEPLLKGKEVISEENSFPTLLDVSRIAEGVLAHVSAYLQKEKDTGGETSLRKEEEEEGGSAKVSPDTEDDVLNIVSLYAEEPTNETKASPLSNVQDSDELIIEPIGGFTDDGGAAAHGVDDEGLGLNEEAASNDVTKRPKGESSLIPVSSTPTVFSSRYLHTEESECSVLTCLNQFTSIELMTGNNKVGCSTCTARLHKGSKESKTVYTMSTKQLLIKSAPPVLILHLKRFQVQMYSFRKLSKHVSFPIVLDLAPFCVDSQKTSQEDEESEENNKEILYSLYGVVEHSGTFNGGHYVAYVKVDEGDNGSRRWFYISDSHFLEVSESRVLSSQAYLLFYRRLGPPPPAAT